MNPPVHILMFLILLGGLSLIAGFLSAPRRDRLIDYGVFTLIAAAAMWLATIVKVM